MASIRQCCITVKARLSYIYFLSSAGNYSLLQQAFRRKSVFSDEVFCRKSVILQLENQRKSVDMLYRKIEKYIVTHLQSESDKILIVDGARQIGKSYIIREVGKKLFPKLHRSETESLVTGSGILQV